MNWILKTARLLLVVSLLGALQPTAAHAQASGVTYIVQAGDTLYGIAQMLGLTLEEIQSANPSVNPATLAIGQALVIPGLAGINGTLTSRPLEAGESLDSLAMRLGLKRETLIRLNHLINPEVLYIGEKMIVVEPADGGVPLPTGGMRTAQLNEGLLALAAAANQNPWALAAQNRLPHPGRLPPGASVVLPGGETATKALPYPVRDIRLNPLPPEQGRTVSVQMMATRPVTLTGSLGDWPLHFNTDPALAGTQSALLGVDRWAEPGLYRLTLDITDANGAHNRFSQLLNVQDGGYGADVPLQVDPATLDPAVTGPEMEQLKSVIAPYTPARYWAGKFVAPSVGGVTSRYGGLRSYNGGPYNAFHTGVDFSGGTDRPVTAPAPGIVVFTGTQIVRGNIILLDHGWGVYSGYWHLSAINVQIGQRVETGETLGYQGSSGRVTGPHLHWEIWVGGFQTDPLQWMTIEFP